MDELREVRLAQKSAEEESAPSPEDPVDGSEAASSPPSPGTEPPLLPAQSESYRSPPSRSNSKGNSLAPPERSFSKSGTRRNSGDNFFQILDEIKKLQTRLQIAHELAVAGGPKSNIESRSHSIASEVGGRRSLTAQKVRILSAIEPSDSQLTEPLATASPGTAYESPQVELPNVNADELEAGGEIFASGGSANPEIQNSSGASMSMTVPNPNQQDTQEMHMSLVHKLSLRARGTQSMDSDDDESMSKSGPEFELRKEWGLNQGSLSRKLKRGLTSLHNSTPRDVCSEKSRPARTGQIQTEDLSEQQDQRCIVRPSSRVRVCWDVLAMVVLVYDLITIPIQVFYFEEVADRFLFVLQILIMLYWVADIPASLCTAVYVNNTLLLRRRDIAKNYVLSWMFFDILVLTPDIFTMVGVLTPDIFTMVGEFTRSDVGAADQVGIVRAVRAGRLFRLLRILRLLRIAKLLKVLNTLKAQVNNALLFLALSIAKFGFLVLYMGHVLACLWFAVGDVEDGWVTEKDLVSQSFGTQYLEAVQWALSRVPLSMMQQNIILKTGAERGLAIGASFVALGFGSVFISSITNTMADIQRRRERKKQLLQSVREYCSSHHISASHAMRIKSFVEREHSRKKTLKAHLELLETLPQDMLRELFHEARSSTLESHVFFYDIGLKDRPMQMDLCCKAVNEQYMLFGDKIFRTGEPAEAMYFVSTGYCKYEYTPPKPPKPPPPASPRQTSGPAGRRQSSFLGVFGPGGPEMSIQVRRLSSGNVIRDVPSSTSLCAGCWISEHALWVLGWKVHGVLEATTDGWLLTLNATDAHKCFQEYPDTLVDAVVHARRFLDKLNETFELSYVSDLPMNLEDETMAIAHNFLSGWMVNERRMVHPAEEAFAVNS